MFWHEVCVGSQAGKFHMADLFVKGIPVVGILALPTDGVTPVLSKSIFRSIEDVHIVLRQIDELFVGDDLKPV